MGIEDCKLGILSGLERLSNNKEVKEPKKVTDFKMIQENDIVQFDYSLVDKDTAEYLKEKEMRIIKIKTMSVMAIGKELKEAHEKLANNKTGVFGKWCESIGITDRTARNYINVYNYIRKSFPDIKDAENIQTSLLFAISKPSAPLELQEAVIDGDITTHKEYKELETKLKKLEREKKDTISGYNQLEKKYYENKDRYKEIKEELEDTRNKIKEIEGEKNNTKIATAIIEKTDETVYEELKELRERAVSLESSADLIALLKILNNNIISITKLIMNAKGNISLLYYSNEMNNIKENIRILKNISLESFEVDLFDFINFK